MFRFTRPFSILMLLIFVASCSFFKKSDRKEDRAAEDTLSSDVKGSSIRRVDNDTTSRNADEDSVPVKVMPKKVLGEAMYVKYIINKSCFLSGTIAQNKKGFFFKVDGTDCSYLDQELYLNKHNVFLNEWFNELDIDVGSRLSYSYPHRINVSSTLTQKLIQINQERFNVKFEVEDKGQTMNSKAEILQLIVIDKY